jgi:hypothetical protein
MKLNRLRRLDYLLDLLGVAVSAFAWQLPVFTPPAG